MSRWALRFSEGTVWSDSFSLESFSQHYTWKGNLCVWVWICQMSECPHQCVCVCVVFSLNFFLSKAAAEAVLYSGITFTLFTIWTHFPVAAAATRHLLLSLVFRPRCETHSRVVTSSLFKNTAVTNEVWGEACVTSWVGKELFDLFTSRISSQRLNLNWKSQ